MFSTFDTLLDQAETQQTIDELYEPHLRNPASLKEYYIGSTFLSWLVLSRRLHVAYLRRGLERLSAGFTSLDASKPWICYWIVHSLDLLGESLDEALRSRILNTIAACQHPQGGFGGGPRQLAHLACTFAAVCTLAILNSPEAAAVIDQGRLLSFLLRMKQPNGAFTVHEDGEMDVRGSYCAIAVASLTRTLTPAVRANASAFIRSCQTWEGGLGAVPSAEAHAGYTYCGVAALSILGEMEVLDLPALHRFAARSQCALSGGFRGRTNKLVDGCYSFWSGALFPLLRAAHAHATEGSSSYFDSLALQRYILIVCQNEGGGGGLRDKPGKAEDYYHTCYCLAGLSIAQRETAADLTIEGGEAEQKGAGGIVLGDAANLLPAVLPQYNLRPERVRSMLQSYVPLAS